MLHDEIMITFLFLQWIRLQLLNSLDHGHAVEAFKDSVKKIHVGQFRVDVMVLILARTPRRVPAHVNSTSMILVPARVRRFLAITSDLPSSRLASTLLTSKVVRCGFAATGALARRPSVGHGARGAGERLIDREGKQGEEKERLAKNEVVLEKRGVDELRETCGGHWQHIPINRQATYAIVVHKKKQDKVITHNFGIVM
ncbi:hypothetical protein Sjap_012682 [Stephania japonica]|uniref:Uncharacterized protein n=1 Tax=Stephania japonica TaxID=461633 RepID=A0AAP0IX85_9MAGN